MIKGALFDIDDTLFSHPQHRVPEKNYELLRKLRKKGIKTGFCTSRMIRELSNLPDDLWNLMDCKIMGTGSTTMIEGKYYKSYFIEKAREYVDYFKSHNITYSYCDTNGDLFYWGDESYIEDGRLLQWANGEVLVKEYEDEDITNLFYYYADEEEIKHILSINPDAYISKWGNCGNICASYVDKAFGVLKFCQAFGFTTDEVVACGDGSNDGEMLEMAGIGIATDDASERTKKMADYVCEKSIEDGGLYEMFIKLGIIED